MLRYVYLIETIKIRMDLLIEQDLGKYFRHQYDPLFPPPYKTGHNSSRVAHKVSFYPLPTST
jgi:hypothetical protein